MHFESKKAENCFANAENYQYRIEVPGSEFVTMLREAGDSSVHEAPTTSLSTCNGPDETPLNPKLASLRINDKLRRPTFIAQLQNGMQLKGLLDKNIIKVGYVPECAEEQRAAFEAWLAQL